MSDAVELLRLGAVATEVKAGPAAGVIEGYASTFNGPVDSYGDVIANSAFAASLAEHKGRGTSPAMLWSHDPAEPIGKWTSLREDQHGLFVTGRLTMEVERAREAYALAKDGVLGLSIGFRSRKASRDGAGHRVLTEIELLETSLVGLPANTAARITSVRSALPPAQDVTDVRSFERLLRDLGFARSLAAGIAAKGWNAAVRRGEPEPEAIAELVCDIRSRTAYLNQLIRK